MIHGSVQEEALPAVLDDRASLPLENPGPVDETGPCNGTGIDPEEE
jgi:hypothetical protein